MTFGGWLSSSFESQIILGFADFGEDILIGLEKFVNESDTESVFFAHFVFIVRDDPLEIPGGACLAGQQASTAPAWGTVEAKPARVVENQDHRHLSEPSVIEGLVETEIAAIPVERAFAFHGGPYLQRIVGHVGRRDVASCAVARRDVSQPFAAGDEIQSGVLRAIHVAAP